MNLKEIQEMVFKEYIKNGYLKMWNNNTKYSHIHRNHKVYDIAELALINTEVSEATEELRKKKTRKFFIGVECADIMIRTLNFMSRKGLDAEFYINFKHEKNMNREKLHGRGV